MKMRPKGPGFERSLPWFWEESTIALRGIHYGSERKLSWLWEDSAMALKEICNGSERSPSWLWEAYVLVRCCCCCCCCWCCWCCCCSQYPNLTYFPQSHDELLSEHWQIHLIALTESSQKRDRFILESWQTTLRACGFIFRWKKINNKVTKSFLFTQTNFFFKLF